MGKIETFNISQLKKKHNLMNFFQTGTFLGDGVLNVMKYKFKNYISIELLSQNYNKAKQILYNSKVIHFGGIGHHCGGMQYRYKIFMQFVEKYKDLMLL